MRARAHSNYSSQILDQHYTCLQGIILSLHTFSSHLAGKSLFLTPLSEPNALQQRAVHRLKYDVRLFYVLVTCYEAQIIAFWSFQRHERQGAVRKEWC